MSLVESVQARLVTGLGGYATGGVVLDPPTPGDTGVFGIDSDGIARIRRVIYVYESSASRAGPYDTSSIVFVHLACYAPTMRECEELERRARVALLHAQLGDDLRHLRWFDAGTVVPDRGYDPPELYKLARYQATGLWGET